MKKSIYALLGVFVLIGACKKELDFGKFENLTLNTEVAVPLFTTEIVMDSILSGADSNIVKDPDGFYRYIRREDSVAGFSVDDIVSIPPLAPTEINSKLGLISIDNSTTSQSKTLGDMSANFNSSTKSALDAISGQVAIFPAITDQNNTISNIALGTTDFNSISLAQGFMVMNFTNELPVTIDEIKVNIYNTIPFQVFIGQLVFRNIAPFASKKDSLNLTGVSLSSGLGYSLPSFKSFASTSPVLINTADKIKFDVSTVGLKAYAGAAVFPSQTINPQTMNFDMKSDDPSVRIRKLTFDAGKINYNITSTVNEKIQIKITIPGSMKNGGPMAPIIIDVNGNAKTGYIDLANVEFDLSQDGTQPYNKLRVDVEPKLVSSNQIKNFDSSNYVNASFSFTNLAFKEVNGFLGTQEINIDSSSTELDFLDTYTGGLPLDDPKIKIITSNSIGVPATVSLNAYGLSASGQRQDLNAPSFIIGYPNNAQKGQVINDVKVIDKTNSSIQAMLNLPPKTISFGGKATINAGGFTGSYNDFILKGTGIKVGYEIEMPFSLKSDNMEVNQTSDNPFFELDANGNIVKPSLVKDLNDLEYLDLLLKVDNGIPFDISMVMYFRSANQTQAQDSIVAGTLMESAIPDANGRTQTNTVSLKTIRFTAEQMKRMQQNNLGKMDIKIVIKTYNNGNEVVKIYSDYKIKIGFATRIKLNLKVKK